MAIDFTAISPNPALLDLPWSVPLEEWPEEHLAALPRGILPLGVVSRTVSHAPAWLARAGG